MYWIIRTHGRKWYRGMTQITRKLFTLVLALALLAGFVSTAQAANSIAETPPETSEASVGPAAPSVQDEAVFQYSEGLRLFQDAQFHAAKGNTSAWKRVLKEARKKFEDALEIEPDFVEAKSNIGYVELTLEDYKHAIETFKSVASQYPHHLETLNGLATAYAFNGEIDDAVLTFEQLTLLAPGNADYLFNYGSVLQRAARYDDAKRVYDRALKVDSRHQRVLFNLGTLYQNQGALDEAVGYYDRAKTAAIGNTVGLEAMNRLKEIEYLKNRELLEEQAAEEESQAGAEEPETEPKN